MNNITWKYVKELTNKSAVDEFEKKNKVSFPTDLKNCIKANNGGRPDKNIFDSEKTKERVFKTLLSFNENDIETIYKYYPVIKKEMPSLVPFAIDSFGNFLCINENKVVFFLHETDEIENVANSFSELLDKLYI
jgi:cell wall assembly regulator SMI1